MSEQNVQAPSFAALNLSSPLLDTLTEIGYLTPSPIQEKTIPALLEGHDVIGQAQTGTGKTAAFALPLLERLDPKALGPRILVLAPTRELATQVAENISLYSKKLPNIRVACICGGQDYSTQLKQLKAGAQIVVGTPGRIMDHIERKTLKLNQLQAFVLDEADEMLRMGFIDDVEWVLGKLPEKRQIALFSATMPTRIRKIAETYLVEPKMIAIKSKTATVSNIRQRYIYAHFNQKNDALLRLLTIEKTDGVIVFVRTKNQTEEVSGFLKASGFRSKAINGDITQNLRVTAVSELKSGKIDILVATDVAARGLDIDRISHVINYDISFDAETYIHRIGRTGRAGRSGEAILFVTPKESRMLSTIERTTKQKIEKIQIPSDHEVNLAQNARLKDQIIHCIGQHTHHDYKAIIEEIMAESDVSPIDVAAAIAAFAWKKPKLKAAQKVREPRDLGASRDRSHARERSNGRDRANGRERSSGHKSRRSQLDASAMQQILYRIDVGKKHGVRPGNIVGAIANEAGLEGKYINDLKIHDEYSTVALPDGMPKEVFRDLKNTHVCGRKLNLAPC